MAHIETIDIIDTVSGKIHGKSEYYLYTNRVSGKQSVRKIGNDPNKPATEKQKAQRAAFAEKTRAVSEWFNENKPSDKNPDGTALYQQTLAEFKAQRIVGDMYHFVWKMLFK